MSENNTKPNGKIPDITIRQALEEADLFALRAFLRKEASRNKHLSIKLKTTFIESITLDNGRDKFDALLGELIREDQYGIVVLTKREVKLLADVSGSFLQLSSKLYRNEAYRDNYDLLIVMLRKLHRYLDKVEEKPTELVARLTAVYDGLTAILRADVAPELRDAIFSDGMRLLGRSYYTIHDISKNMVAVLLMAHSVPSQVHAVRKVIESKVSMPNTDDRRAWCTWYGVICEFGKTDLDRIFLHQVLTHGEIFQIAKDLKNLGYDEAQHTWIEQFDNSVNLSRPKRHEWDTWRFRSSLRLHDEEGILSSGIKLLLQTESKEVYQKIKSHYPSRHDIIDRLRESASPVLLAEILVFEKDWNELEALIRAENDLELLLTHLHHICAHSKTAFGTIHSIVDHFATHCAGASCRDGLSSVIFQLGDLGYSDLASQLGTTINSEFPGRFTRINSGLNISC